MKTYQVSILHRRFVSQVSSVMRQQYMNVILPGRMSHIYLTFEFELILYYRSAHTMEFRVICRICHSAAKV